MVMLLLSPSCYCHRLVSLFLSFPCWLLLSVLVGIIKPLASVIRAMCGPCVLFLCTARRACSLNRWAIDVGVNCASVSQMLDAHMFHKTSVCCCCSCKPLVSLLLYLYVLSVLFLFVLLVILLLCAARVCSLLSSMYGMFVMTSLWLPG